MEKGARFADKKADHPGAALSDGEVKRIFIGGVGAGVTDADVNKTFSPLGRVHAVEFVRNNGRNFAFMDFEPSSVKSMANLFSTYNGCTWKGGKLKLEIAKEHYLTRLKREWVEDAKPASTPPTTEDNLKIVGTQFSNQENSQIRIFFPKLRKVKPLPFKGTGKHKYSFQRVEVSPLPIHFCDCEEHSKALESTGQKYRSPLITVVHEKEQKIMSNVINKLIEGDQSLTSPGGQMQAAPGANALSPSKEEDILSKEAENFDTDDDNLVINVGTATVDDVLMQLKGAMTLLTGQVEKRADSSKRKKPEAIDASSIKPSKRSRSVSSDKLSEHEPAPAITQNITSDFAPRESAPPFTPISSEPPDKAPEPLHETPAAERPEPNPGNNAQPPEGRSWVQKSSWKNLVGGGGSSSFSISTLLSGLPPAPPNVPTNSHAVDTDTRPASKKLELFGTKSTRITPLNPQPTPGMHPKAPPSVRGKPGGGETSLREQKPEFSLGGVRPFMRSAESELQWSKAKAALGGLLKGKGGGGKAMAPGKR